MFPLATQLIYKSLKWPWNHILIQRSKNFGLRGGGWEEGLFLLYLSPVLINFAIKIQFLIYVILFFKFYLLVKRQRNIKVLVYILCIQKHPQSTQQQHGNHQSSMTAIIYNGDNSLFVSLLHPECLFVIPFSSGS